MLSRLLKLTRWLSIPIFLICLAIAVRTAFIWDEPDMFSFDRSSPPKWHCAIWLDLFGVASEWSTLHESVGRPFGAGPGSFHYRRLTARSDIVALFNSIVLTHDYYLFGWKTYSNRGTILRTSYWIHLPFAPFIALLASSAILIHWRLQTLKHRRQNRQGLCPTCSYDLRAHHPGQRCPECGTPISIDSQPLRN